ncbi:MAG: IPT/TIG domain-containing protein [Melioribacteraceae bacterium]|nr:IPT/TIG domain-containing protein [Melioribacteraceae bacterium]
MLKRIKRMLLLSIFSGISVFTLTQCSNDYPDSVYNPDASFKTNPTITQLQPDSALAGIDKITISGTNFSATLDENIVYFNGEKATVLSSDANRIVVQAPNVPADSLKVQVSVAGALNFAEFTPYKLMPAIIDYSDFDKFDETSGLAMDTDENLFVSLDSPTRIVKVGTDQKRNDYTATIRKSTQMKYGPDGTIFYVNAIQYLLKVNADGAGDELFAILPGAAYDLDFDQNQNIFCGGGPGDIYRVKMDKSNETKYQHPDVYIHALRVYNNYLYVGGTYSGSDGNHPKEAVWRHEITSADGDLGEKELVFNFGESFVGFTVLSLAFDIDGLMYIGTDATEGIIVVNLDGTYNPLYEGVMEGEAYAMTWGNGDFLYVTRKNVDEDKRRILRINMRKTTAPYFGRD